MEEKEFRNKVYWLTFLFSVLVIWVHSYNAVLYLGNAAAAYKINRLERFLGHSVAQIAVPGFFMISSYLFFRNFTMERLMSKWSSRIRSLLVPYIVWNSIYYCGYVIGSRIPVLSQIIGKGKIPFSLSVMVDAILNYTYNYVFWYLYQLILLIILAPAIYLMIKRLWLGVLWLGGILAAVYLGMALPYLNLDALFYFSLAAFGAFHGKRMIEGIWSKKKAAVGIGVFLIALALKWKGLPGEHAGELVVTTVVLRAAAPAALWLILPELRLPKSQEWMKYNFFLYAVHFALVRLINKTGALVLPSVPIVPILIYLLMPVMAVAISYALGRLLKRVQPVVWILLNGGR